MKRLEIIKDSENLLILKGLLSRLIGLLAGEILTKTFPSIVQALEIILFLRFLLASFNSSRLKEVRFSFIYMPFEETIEAADASGKASDREVFLNFVRCL